MTNLTDPKSLNLKNINYLKKYKLPVGYQDHSNFDISGYTIPATAIGLGINIIEKHVTDSDLRNGTDRESTMKLRIIKFLSNIMRLMSLVIEKIINKSELIYRITQKKS